MKAKFKKAKVIIDGEDAYLCVSIPFRDAKKFVGEMKPKKYSVEIKEYKKPRSLDANAYFWVLLDQLAGKVNKPKTEIYKDYIREIDGVSEVYGVKNVAVERFREAWLRKGIGWQIDTMPSKKSEDVTNVIAYFGSSTFNTEQMSKLIGFVVEDCRQYGIETMTPRELALLNEEWGRSCEKEKNKRA
jgi:hypothetical protein